MSYIAGGDFDPNFDPGAIFESVFGPSAKDFPARIATVKASIQDFRSTWQGAILPALGGSNEVPAQFVIDIVGSLIDNVSVPMSVMQGPLLERVSLIGGVGILVGGATTAAAKLVINEIIQTGTLANFLMNERLVPLQAQAKQLREAGGKTAMMEIDTTGPDRFDSLVTQTMEAGVDAFEKLNQISIDLDKGIVGLVGDVLVGYFKYIETQGKALEELGKFLSDIAHNVYNAVTGFARFVDLMIKGTLVLGGAYIAYQIFKPSQQSNPGRRRRRRKRRRR